MPELPFGYGYINSAVSQGSPNTFHTDSNLTRYFERYLLKRAISVLKWTLPENWDENYFKYVLYSIGYIGVVETDRFGVICQQCGLQGFNVYYQPTNIIIANPLLKGIEMPTIGVNAALLRLQPDYSSILDIVKYYAEKLAMVSQGIDINIFNSKLAYVFYADKKAQAQSFKKMMDELSCGNPAVVVDSTLNLKDRQAMLNTNLRQTYIAGDMLQDMKRINDEFNTLIGIPNANTEKKERLITDEVNANNEETKSLTDIILDSLKPGIDMANSLFGINIKVEARYAKNDGNNVNTGLTEPE